MPKNSPVGLDFAESMAKAMEEMAVSSPEPASEGEVAEPVEVSKHEQPVVEPKVEEEVGLLSALYDNAEENGEEQPSGDSTFTIDGKTVTIEEMRNGYLRQSDYTKKTQEIAQMREKLEKAEALWDAMQSDPMGTLRQLQQRLNQGQRPVDQPVNTGTDIDALVAAKVQEILGNDPTIRKVAESSAKADEDATFAAIEKDYAVKLEPKDRQEVLKRAEKLGVTGAEGMRIVFAGLLQEAQRIEAQRKQLGKASTASGRFSAGESEDSFDDLEVTDFWSAVDKASKQLGLEKLLK